MNFPDDLKYTTNDEWVRIEANNGTIGISDYAQDQLSDIVFIDIGVSVGDEIAAGDEIGTVESVKAVSNLYSPMSGKVVEVNDPLLDAPELVNSDPYGDAWAIKIEIINASEADSLMDSVAYKINMEERDA
jgi:glycine cleavage system H protein